MTIANSLKNAKLISSGLAESKGNTPSQYSGRQHRYYENESNKFLNQYAKYASDFVEAEVQGLNPEDFFEWRKVMIRMSEVVKPSAAATNNFDDYKNIVITSEGIDYIPKGAKINAMGSTWLVVNPANISGSDGNSLIRRCDAVYNYLDFYGNVCSEPICVNDLSANANDNDSQRSTMITKGYFQVVCQYNDVTKNLDNNARLILGRNAYRITGYADFSQEFTGDYDSIRMIGFTIRYEEPNDAIDDMVNHVPGGKTFAWDIAISGNNVIGVGSTSQLTISSKRTCNEKTSAVTSTTLHPVAYQWRSSNPSIATVNRNGAISGVAVGEAIISAYLVQNPSKTANFAVKVEAVSSAPHVEFTSTTPSFLRYGQSITVNAQYIEDGTATADIVEWTFTNAAEEAYSYTILGNALTLKCWGGSVNDLTVTATCKGKSESFIIGLRGI